MVFKSYRRSRRDTVHQRVWRAGRGETTCQARAVMQQQIVFRWGWRECQLAICCACLLVHLQAWVEEVALEYVATPPVAWQLHPWFFCFVFVCFFNLGKSFCNMCRDGWNDGGSEKLCNANKSSPLKWEEMQKFPWGVWLFTAFGKGSEILRRKV